MDVSLNDWVTHAPPQIVIDHLRISKETLAAIPREKSVVMPTMAKT